MMRTFVARHGRAQSVGCLAVILCLGVPVPGNADRQQASIAETLSLSCEPSILQAPWTGSDAVTCRVATTVAIPADVALTCENPPPGLACAVSPQVVRLSSGTPARVVVTVSYTEMLEPGRASFRVIAKHGDSQATHPLAVVKDINTVSARCPSADEIRRIDRDLSLEFDYDPTKNLEHPERCTKSAGSRDLSVMQARVYRSLATLRRLTFEQPLPWTRDSAYRWLTRTVKGVRFRGDIANSSCCGPDGMINVKTPVESVDPSSHALPVGNGAIGLVRADQSRGVSVTGRRIQ